MVVIHRPDDGKIDYDLTSGLTHVVGISRPCSSDVYDINGRKVSLPAKHDGIFFFLSSVSNHHTESEYVFFEMLLVYGIVLEHGTVVIYGLGRIRQDAGYLGTLGDA